MIKDTISIKRARVHNLKNISLEIPKNKLVVITGVSGSGKSSLAFDTIYAEGQRRYVESLSAYARQFLGLMAKPAVEKIEGLAPAIAIDQKSVPRNPRSTVGTITEIYDYLRLLYARAGQPHCPRCGRPIASQSPELIVDDILALPAGTQLAILGPVIEGRKGEHRGVIGEIERMGFVRVRIDQTLMPIEEALDLTLAKNKRHTIEVVVDRIGIPVNRSERVRERSRVADSVETALKIGRGYLKTLVKSRGRSEERLYSEKATCSACQTALPAIEPRTFSFNSPYGACPACHGLGETMRFDPRLIIPNPALSIAEGAIKPWATASHRVGRQGWYWYILRQLAEELGFSLSTPWQELTPDIQNLILYGRKKAAVDSNAPDLSSDLNSANAFRTGFEPVTVNLRRRYRETGSEATRAELEKYTNVKRCPACRGQRLRPEALAVTVWGHSISALAEMAVAETARLLQQKLDAIADRSKNKEPAATSPTQAAIAMPILKEITRRLQFLVDVGLDYLTLNRPANTLAGGEAQRIRLATQVGSGLTGVIYVLDEPSIGLHQRDQARLIEILIKLRDLGNTVIVVEHDRQTIEAADWIIDIGPGAGKHGGRITAQGPPQKFLKSPTLTAAYLNNQKTIARTRREPSLGGQIVIRGAREHNLKNIDVKLPLNQLICVTGVSGSGKSTLVNDILARALAVQFFNSRLQPGKHDRIEGLEQLDRVSIVDQSPIGRTPRSNPATYTGIFTPIREVFARTREARVRGYTPGRFSFNVKGGRCENCRGDGSLKIEMHFLTDVYVTCEVCQGKRYNKDALAIRYRDADIAEVLAMSVEEAHEFFAHIPVLKRHLKTMLDVGLGYLELGQPAPTLSGGEAQRIKLTKELGKARRGRTFYILDEPTTGLHFEDVAKLINVLSKLVSKGNTVLVIEHNLDVIKNADWLIDLGPEGGEAGGRVVAEGRPAAVAQVSSSYTGQFLKKDMQSEAQSR